MLSDSNSRKTRGPRANSVGPASAAEARPAPGANHYLASDNQSLFSAAPAVDVPVDTTKFKKFDDVRFTNLE